MACLSLYTLFLGLQPAVDALNQAYGEFSNTGISRADFYAKCGQVAAERGRQNAGKLSSHTAQCKRHPIMHCSVFDNKDFSSHLHQSLYEYNCYYFPALEQKIISRLIFNY